MSTRLASNSSVGYIENDSTAIPCPVTYAAKQNLQCIIDEVNQAANINLDGASGGSMSSGRIGP